MELDQTRKDILAATGHILIQGGPGSGKTTIALLRARQALDTLDVEQRVLFLSFSRAAVRQISDRMKGILTRQGHDRLEIRTFHSFFLDLVRGHGRLLTGKSPSFIAPDQEKQLEADFDGDWTAETHRLAREDARFTFDLLADTAATLLERSTAVRELYADAYPLIIVDEFQDTNTDQWRAVHALSDSSTIVCLADPDQRIFDHIPGVDETRIPQAIQTLRPTTFDLSKDNYRSPSGGLLDYANAVLRNDRSVTKPGSITMNHYYQPARCEVTVHRAIVELTERLTRTHGKVPTIAVLAPTNNMAGRISEVISTSRTVSGRPLPVIDHELHWDPALSAAAGYVVASILQWPGLRRGPAINATLQAIVDYYRIKFAGGTTGARKKAETIENAIEAFTSGAGVKSKAAKAVMAAFDQGIELTGDPVADWQTARGRLQGATELTEIDTTARLLRLFKATDVLAWALIDAWDGNAAYIDAAGTLRRVMAAEALDAAQQQPAPVSLMSMHKSKGKEFDGVIIVEGAYRDRLLDRSWSGKEVQAKRRLLRVAITRARHAVTFVRPNDCLPLIGGRW